VVASTIHNDESVTVFMRERNKGKMNGRNTKYHKQIIIERTKYYDNKNSDVGVSDKKKKTSSFDDNIYVNFYHVTRP